MFDFENLTAYRKIRLLNGRVLKCIYNNNNIDLYMQDQWKRATISISLNLAEGTGRASSADKRHFYIIARGSLYESVTILQLVFDLGLINDKLYRELYSAYDEISRMIYGLYKNPSPLKVQKSK